MKSENKTQGQALYRKYRPEEWKDLLGQDHVVDVLKSALKNGKISHAYLFSGSRGTGKTSIARILARELGTSVNDIFEIDAASNNGVDDVRELRESVRSLPFDSKYKIYILDEVHMFSKGAWNALLKTLEEPPAHVIFILATTEIEKVPDTILSRCQVFTFKKPNERTLSELAETVAEKEGFVLDAGVASLIATLGDGSFRDTQGILQKVLTYSKNKKINIEEVEMVTGAPKQTLVEEYIGAIAEKDIEKGLGALRVLGEQNIDVRVFIKLVLNIFRLALLSRVSPSFLKNVSNTHGESVARFIEGILSKKPETITSKSLLVLLEAYSNSKTNTIGTLPLELALLEIVGEVSAEV